MEWLISFLNLFGISPDKYPYLVLAIIIIAGAIYIRIAIGDQLAKIGEKVAKIKDNVLVIVTHLSAAHAKTLDTNLIQSMSPLTIQPAGEKVLGESGFIALFKANPQRFFQYVVGMEPMNRLEVEQYSITSVFIVLNSKDEALNPLQTYLYEHPNVRDTFTTLAGVYVRDEYLTLHPEIAI